MLIGIADPHHQRIHKTSGDCEDENQAKGRSQHKGGALMKRSPWWQWDFIPQGPGGQSRAHGAPDRRTGSWHPSTNISQLPSSSVCPPLWARESPSKEERSQGGQVRDGECEGWGQITGSSEWCAPYLWLQITNKCSTWTAIQPHALCFFACIF